MNKLQNIRSTTVKDGLNGSGWMRIGQALDFTLVNSAIRDRTSSLVLGPGSQRHLIFTVYADADRRHITLVPTGEEGSIRRKGPKSPVAKKVDEHLVDPVGFLVLNPVCCIFHPLQSSSVAKREVGLGHVAVDEPIVRPPDKKRRDANAGVARRLRLVTQDGPIPVNHGAHGP